MKFFKLSDDVVRNHLSAEVFYKVNDDLTEQEILVVDRNKKVQRSHIENEPEALDTSDCFEISPREY